MACSKPDSYFPALKKPMLVKDALKGKVAFITGGGTGLGKAMALAFSALGANVAIASRRMDVLQQAASEIKDKTGNKVVPIQLNVKDPAEVSRAAEECVSKLGLPNIIGIAHKLDEQFVKHQVSEFWMEWNPNVELSINNAAGNFISPTERLSPNAFKTVVDIVLMGTVYVTLEFGKRLIQAKQGASFLSITTSYARHGSPYVTPSAASKAGVETFSKSMAAEWGKYGMRFNCIAPGSIYTEGAMTRLDPTGQAQSEGPKHIPAGRLGETEELANLASYIVSDYGSWMSGSIVDFDGGAQRLSGGMFSALHKVTPDQWNQLEGTIRQKTGKSKI